MDNLIRFEHIIKRFGGICALNDVSFTIGTGEIHAVVGENGAGKSTLMNILSGTFQQDEGGIYLNGEKVTIKNQVDAHRQGIATVYQELKLCNNLTVMENFFLGREEVRARLFLNNAVMEKGCQVALDEFGLKVDINATLSDLSIAEMQMVEIAKAVFWNADILILDEPTSSLTVRETEILFKNVRLLKEKGKTVIFISHRLDEVFAITDRISVLRNGCYLGTMNTSETTKSEVISRIAGKELSKVYNSTIVKEKKQHAPEDVMLEVSGLTNGSWFRDVSFELHRGEILGFYGLQGSGRTELVETIFGLRRHDVGTIRVRGAQVRLDSPRRAIEAGFGFVPEDRKLAAVFSQMDIEENINIIHDKKISKGTIISSRKTRAIANEFVEKLSVKTAGLWQLIVNLSGGNQQKVILGRCLSTEPEILLLDEPTRGIDVGAKAEIYDILHELKQQNKAIILVSSELEEIIYCSDRVVVMRAGELSEILEGEDITQNRIVECCF